MVRPHTLASAAASLLLLPGAAVAEGIYSSSSPVLQVDARSYDSLIAKSNHTSIVEFYAPWCGHCKNLKPAYEKAAKSLAGLAKVAAVNCDEESNKQFCGSMGVQGFPTLKIVRPGKKAGRPAVEDYQGGRTTKAIVDAVVDKIPNHVKRLKDADYAAWLAEVGPRAVLFSDKGTVSGLLKAIAIDFLGGIAVAQIRDKEAAAVAAFGITKFPTLVLFPGEGKEPLTYAGDMKKPAIVEFLSQISAPNPDPAPKAKKAASGSADKKKAAKPASASKKVPPQASEKLTEDNAKPVGSPGPQVVTDEAHKPVKLPDVAPPIVSLQEGLSLQQKCLNDKAGVCILALLPEPSDVTALPQLARAVSVLSELQHKHAAGGKRNLFPFYQIPHANSQGAALRSRLSLPAGSVQLLATNGKRGWYKLYSSEEKQFSATAVEAWVDAIRMGEGEKKDLPSGLILPAADLPAEPVQVEPPVVPAGGAAAAGSPELDEMREKILQGMPEGMDVEIEEVTDEQYAQYMAQQKGKPAQEPIVHSEL